MSFNAPPYPGSVSPAPAGSERWSPEPVNRDVTQLLQKLSSGDDGALPELLQAVQGELRRLAAGQLSRERANHTLQPTALVNEAYLKLVDQRVQGFENRGHFLAIAATAMRRILLEHARKRLAEKRGGGAQQVTLFEVESVLDDRPEALMALDEALTQFAKVDPQNARIVELRWFGGLDVEATAATLDVSTRTVERGWRAAKAWLRDRLSE